MDFYLANPRTAPRAGILALHAWWGLNDFIKDFCNRLAEEGYVALAPDLYHEAIAKTIPEAKKLRGKLKREVAALEILEALSNLQSQPGLAGKPTGLIGFSLGAYWALWLVEDKPEAINATVLFYGTRGGIYSGTKSAFLGHYAENDDYVSASGRQRLEKTLRSAGKEAAFYPYPGTGHWFFENDNHAYNAAAADLAWQRTLSFLHEQLG